MPDHRPPDNLDPDDLGATQVIQTTDARLSDGLLLAGRFEIRRHVGQGRFGCVYQAWDRTLDTLVAIKVLHGSLASDGQSLAEFKQEILLLRQLSHPNIVRVHEYYLDGEHHFITMDWIEGESLQQRMSQGQIARNDLESIMEQLISALVFAERQQVVHRDLKPDNILLDENGQLYLVDFGLALMGNAETGAVIAGTPYYAAPEYLTHGDVSAATDQYALGVILYQLCCGGLPFEADRLDNLVKQKQQAKFKFEPLDRSLKHYEPLIRRLLTPQPHQRFESMTQLQQQWQGLQQLDNSSKTLSWLPAVLLTALLLAVAAVIFWSKDSPSTTQATDLALLPVVSDSENASQYLNDFLLFQLQQQPNLRLVGHQRSEQTLSLLGIQPPYREQQLKLLSELLQVNYLLSIRQISLQQNNQLMAELIVVDGIDVTSESLLSSDWNSESLDSVLLQLIDRVNARLALPEQPILPLGGDEQVAQLGKVQDLIRQQQFPRAVELLQQQIAQHESHAALWFQLGLVHWYQDDSTQAEVALRKARELSPANSLIYLRASALLHRVLQQPEAAAQTYEQLAQQFPRHIDIHFERSEFFIEQQNWTQAERALQQVVALDSHHPFAWYELAKVAIWSGETQRALDDYLVRALVIAKKLKDRVMEGDVLNAFGVAYQRLGDLDNALDYYQQGLEARQASNHLPGVATSYSNLASVHAIRGEFSQAVDVLQQSLTLYSQMNDDEGRANTFNELGLLAEEQGQYREALDYYRQALDLRMLLSDEWLQAESLNNVAFIYYLLSDAAHADIYWRQAEHLYQKLQDPIGLIRVRQGRAQMALSKGQWRESYRLFSESLAQAEQHNLLEESLVAKAYLARLGFLQGNVSQSLNSLQQVFESLQQRQDIRGINEFGLWMASWRTLTADYQGAEKLLTTIEPYIQEQGSVHQQFFYQTVTQHNDFLQSSVLNPVHSMTVSEHTHNELALFALLNRCQQVLQQQPEQYAKVRDQLAEYNLTLHQYEKLRLLEFDAAYAWYMRDWMLLEKLLKQAEQITKQLGGYWRNFQFLRLNGLLLATRGEDATAMQQQALQEFRALLNQLPEHQRSGFIQQQNYLPFNDLLTTGNVYEQ